MWGFLGGLAILAGLFYLCALLIRPDETTRDARARNGGRS